MISTSESMSRSMSLSRTVSSDKSMSIDNNQDKNRVKKIEIKSRFDSPYRDPNYKRINKDRQQQRKYKRSISKNKSISSSSSSDTYEKYKNYKNFKRSRYSRSPYTSRSFSRSRRRSKSTSYSSFTSSRTSSRTISPYTESSISRSKSKSSRRIRRRRIDNYRSSDRRPRDYSPRDRGRRPRLLERREPPRRTRIENKFIYEDQFRMNERSRLPSRLNGFRRTLLRDPRRDQKVDRRFNTPFLLKVLAAVSTQNKEDPVTPEELHVYVWKDNTLRDLVNLIKDISPETRKQRRFWSFSTNKGKESIELGSVHSFKYNSREDNRTLESLKFQVGGSVKLNFRDVF